MKAANFAYAVNQTPKVVAVFQLNSRIPLVAKRCGLTRDDLFYYAGDGVFVRISTYSRFAIPTSSLNFVGYKCWDGKKLRSFRAIP